MSRSGQKVHIRREATQKKSAVAVAVGKRRALKEKNTKTAKQMDNKEMGAAVN
jgi:hypothetical protein